MKNWETEEKNNLISDDMLPFNFLVKSVIKNVRLAAGATESGKVEG